MKSDRDYLEEASRRIRENDPELFDEVVAKPKENFDPVVRGVSEAIMKRRALEGDIAMEGRAIVDPQFVQETVVLKTGRPALLVQDGGYREDDPMLNEGGSSIWKKRLFDATIQKNLLRVIPAVGRVEVRNNPDFEWVGTAWLVRSDIAVTNRHVASEFAFRRGQELVFRRGFPSGTMEASIDFLEEHGRDADATFIVKDVLYLADDDEPDMALLKVEQTNGKGSKLAQPLNLAKGPRDPKEFIATLGYPAADSRVPDQALVKKFFGDIYNKKRLAPGQVIRYRDDLLFHDCSTLGGNSGSSVVDLASGDVLGLHFSGLFLRENRAVPAHVIAAAVGKVGSGPVFNIPREIPAKPPGGDAAPLLLQTPAATAAAPGSPQTLKFTLQVPVELTVALGQPTVAPLAAVVAAAAPATVPNPQAGAPARSIESAVGQIRGQLAGNSSVMEVRKGYAFEDSWITGKEAVVVILADSTARSSLELPQTVDGYPVEIRDPGLAELAPRNFNETAEGVTKTSYKPPGDFSLKEVNQRMKVVCHLSPDAGFPELAKFLEPTRERLTMGIYDFTAPHVVDAMLEAVKDEPKTFKLVMQAGESMKEGSGIKGNDIREKKVIEKFSEAMGDRFEHVAASVGQGRQFASSYHIKVIVRDGEAFWLSSGNIQSSNQYKTIPEAGSTDWWHLANLNREWNIIIENEDLARQYEDFLKYDFENAAAEEGVVSQEFFDIERPEPEKPHAGTPVYFEPLRLDRKVKVMPLLTPDNYMKRVLKLIEGAEEQILFQNQSLNLQGLDSEGNDKNDPRFASLYEALLAKQQAGVDLRIIMRGDFNPESYLERLKDLGFDMSRIRLQNHCHTKGMVIDRKIVVVGSHNWTNEGALANRDASLIFDDEEVAAYFGKVFWFDWKQLARQSVGAPRRVRRVKDAGTESLPGPRWERVSLGGLTADGVPFDMKVP